MLGVDADQSDTVASSGPGGRHLRVTMAARKEIVVRRALPALLAAALIAAVGVFVTVHSTLPAGAATTPVRIMPLGDSITGSPGCWRALLWNRLQSGGDGGGRGLFAGPQKNTAIRPPHARGQKGDPGGLAAPNPPRHPPPPGGRAAPAPPR